MRGLTQASRTNLRQGAVYMMVGLLWGLVVPAAPFPRLALDAHIELTAHGVMFLVAGLVISHLPFAVNGMASWLLVSPPVADVARDAVRDGEWVVGYDEDAADRRRTGGCDWCGRVAGGYRHRCPSPRGSRPDRLLGGHPGRAVPHQRAEHCGERSLTSGDGHRRLIATA